MIDVLKANHAAMQWSDVVFTDIKPDGKIYDHIPGDALEAQPYGTDRNHTNITSHQLSTSAREHRRGSDLRNPYKWTDAALKTGFATALRQTSLPGF